jgi:hypothetical protein
MSFDFKVRGEIIEWRGPAPFTFLRVDEKQSSMIKEQSKNYTYGWGVLYMHGILGKTEFDTTLMPKGGRYLIPIKVAIKKAEGVDLGDIVTVEFNLGQR